MVTAAGVNVTVGDVYAEASDAIEDYRQYREFHEK